MVVSMETNGLPMPPAAPLDAHLGYWLRFVSNHVSQAFAQKLAAQGVTAAEWVVLRDLLDREAETPSLLAERLGMTRGAISKLVDRLVAKRLLSRRVEAADRRYQAVSLTEAGRALVPVLSALADLNDAAFFGHLAPAERDRIQDAMKDIVRRHGLRAVPIE